MSEPGRAREKTSEGAPKLLHAVREGMATIAGNGRLRILIGLAAAQTLVAGALTVLVVVIALQLLERDIAWVGYLEAAIGVGGLAGVLVAAGLVGRRRLAPGIMAGFVLFGAPLALVATLDVPLVALVALALIGVGNTLFDVALYTLLQRAVPEAVLARVFGILETVVLGCIALGGVVAPLLVNGLGLRGALLAWGLLLPALAAVAWPPCARPTPPRRRRGPHSICCAACPCSHRFPSSRSSGWRSTPAPCTWRPAERCSGRAIRATPSTWSPAERSTWPSMARLSHGWTPARASERSPCCATALGRRRLPPASQPTSGRWSATTSSPPSPAIAVAGQAAEHVVVSRLARARPALGTL